LLRPRQGRAIAGVASGLALHLGVSVTVVRLVLVGTTLAMGAGAVLYLWLWLTVPSGDPLRASAESGPAAAARLAPALNDLTRRGNLAQFVLGFAMIAVGIALAISMAVSRDGVNVPWNWVVPAAALVGGVALAWSQLERTDMRSASRPISILRLVAAIVLVVGGILLLMAQGKGPGSLASSALAGLVVLGAVALVLAPWWLRLLRALGDERAARAREAERADIAAHLHDSVLQTLAVIRSRADEPDAIRRLARAQERELREWLYQDRAAPGTSFAADLAKVVADVEDSQGVEVGLVVVGDMAPTPATDAAVWAAREAILNAVRHGRPPVSVYAEVSDGLRVFIRDRGEGFDLAAVPQDRLGVRESIIGRMERAGGSAAVVSSETGTEVRLLLPADKEAS
jgi:signal transduction histidine kinase/phage shock protein PspC (stress-responsive transcriptional regulator)